MPKCPICGKKFETLSALRDHHKNAHKNVPFVAPRVSASRNFVTILIIVIIVVGAAVGYLIYVQETTTGHTGTTTTGILNATIPSALYQNLSTVSTSTLAAVGAGSGVIAQPDAISPAGPTILSDGKPAVLYIGAEFCPLCAAERWAMIVALTQFGNFSGIEYMLSSSTDSPANVPTFSFLNADYTSKYIGFISIENEDRNHNQLQEPNSTETTLWNDYNPDSYPFIYFNGAYVIKTNQYNPSILTSLNWTQIASQLNDPNSSIAKTIDGTANTMISAICAMDGGKPSSICGQSFANLLSYHSTSQSAPLDYSPYPTMMQFITVIPRTKAPG